jgi:hypothetical protein
MRPLPDKILVYGKAFKDSILEMGTGFSSQDVVVAGYSRLDRFLLELSECGYVSVRMAARQRLGVGEGTQVITVTSQPGTGTCLGTFMLTAASALREQDIMVCIKPHPSETGRWQRARFDAFRGAPYRIVTDADMDLYELLVATDVHVTVYSTVFLECLALSVPTVIVGSCPGSAGATKLLSEDEVVVVNTAAEFASLIQRLSRDIGQKQQLVEIGKTTAGRFFSEEHCAIQVAVHQIQECKRRQRRGF